jgi:transposase
MIGVDPHKGSHTAVVIDVAEGRLGELRVRASASQAERLLAWAQAWPERTWAVEGAGGVGHLLAQQLLAAGERALDVAPKLGARVRLLATRDTNKNDPNDARSVAIAALRAPYSAPHTASASALISASANERTISRSRSGLAHSSCSRSHPAPSILDLAAIAVTPHLEFLEQISLRITRWPSHITTPR